MIEDSVELPFAGSDTDVVVIGNPPYNKDWKGGDRDGGRYFGKTMPLYHEFIEGIIDSLEPCQLIFITPSRWMTGGLGLSKFRDRFKRDRRIKYMRHFPGVKDVFKDVQISGGVSYFNWERDYDGPCLFDDGLEAVIRPLEAERGVINVNALERLVRHVRGLVAQDGEVLGVDGWFDKMHQSNHGYGMKSNYDFDTFVSGEADMVPVVRRGREIAWTGPESITKGDGKHTKWRVMTPCKGRPWEEAWVEAYRVNNSSFLNAPWVYNTNSYMEVGYADTYGEILNLQTYISSRFARALLWAGKGSESSRSRNNWLYVPRLASWEGPIENFQDAALYKRFKVPPVLIDWMERWVSDPSGMIVEDARFEKELQDAHTFVKERGDLCVE